jgi:hypothetical protein
MKRLSGSVTLAVALGLGASSRRRGLMCARGCLALGSGRGGQLGDPLLVAALPLGRLSFQQCLGLAQPRQPAGLGGQRGGELVPTSVAVLQVVTLVGLGGLPQDLGYLRLDLVVGVAGGVGGVGSHLGAVQCDQAQADQAGGGAQLQGLDEEAGQGLLVADAEPRDGHVVGQLVAGQDAEGEVLVAAPLDLSGRAHPHGVGVQPHPQQGLRVVGGMPVPVGTVGAQERLKVELVDHVQHEPGQMVGGQPVTKIWGSRKGWSRSPRRKL